MDQAARGKKALAEGKFEEAISEFTAALKLSPTSPDYFIQRSIANQRAKKYADALVDANSGVLNAQKRAKRELIVEAQFRRGCALYSLERYGDADFIFGVVKKMDEKHKMLPMWAQKTKMSLSKLSEDDEKRQCAVKETPEMEESSTDMSERTKSSTEGESSNNGITSIPSQTFVTPAAPQQTPPDKIRHEWYQNNDNVYFTLLAKGVPKDKAQIDVQERSLSISYPLTTGSSFEFTLEPLFGTVQPEKCTTRILSTKIEITLAKAKSGQKWGALESNEPVAATTEQSITAQSDRDEPIQRSALAESTSSGPAYPTSSKTGPKDWDKITKDLRKSETDDKEPSLDDDDDYGGGDEANAFFKKLFKNASPDVQRAMMKSYTESNGTALSTNWDEVSKAPVETTPPDGMEAKAWGK